MPIDTSSAVGSGTIEAIHITPVGVFNILDYMIIAGGLVFLSFVVWYYFSKQRRNKVNEIQPKWVTK